MKYSELIANSKAKQAAEVEAAGQVVADQATLAASELAALNATQESDMADAQLTTAVALKPAGVLDSSTGELYEVVDGKLVVTTPGSADDEVPGPQVNPLRAALRK